MEKIEKILIDCIEDIESGRATLSACLDRHRSYRDELEPLLRMALNIRGPRVAPLDSDSKQKVKAGLLQQINNVKQEKARSFADILSLGLPPRLVWARAAVTVVVIVIIISLLAGGTAYAAQDSLPGDLLYPVKTGTEDARILFAGDNSSKAKLNLQFAQIRLEEMNRLATRSEEKAEIALSGYRDNLDAAEAQISGISDVTSKSAVLGWALDNINEQTAYCDGVIDAGAGYLGPVGEANTITVRTQVKLLQMLEKQDNVRAAQSNIDAMQNRLQRALTKAGENQYQVMQQVLLQYQEFNNLGEEILQRAQNTENHRAEVEALNSQVLPGYLDTLDNMYLHTPQEYRNTIRASQELTLQFETKARNQHQNQVESSGDTASPLASSEGQGPGPDGEVNPPHQAGNGNKDNVTEDTPPPPAPDKGKNMNDGAGSGNATGPQGTNGISNADKGDGDTGPGKGDVPDGGSGGGTDSGKGSGGGDTGNGGDGSGDAPDPGKDNGTDGGKP